MEYGRSDSLELIEGRLRKFSHSGSGSYPQDDELLSEKRYQGESICHDSCWNKV
jgi:hypothetical protein